MEELPNWTSLLINRDVIPYDDLQISPGYGRKILLPDDIPPVLALPWALGPKVPRANRAQDDGSLNVYVTGQAGGGGGGGTLSTVVPVTISTPHNLNGFTNFWWPTGTFAAGIPYKYIYGFMFSHECDTYALGGSFYGNLSITNALTTDELIPLANFVIQPITGTTMTVPVNINIFFPYRIDVLTAIGSSLWKVAALLPGTSASAGFYSLNVIVSN